VFYRLSNHKVLQVPELISLCRLLDRGEQSVVETGKSPLDLARRVDQAVRPISCDDVDNNRGNQTSCNRRNCRQTPVPADGAAEHGANDRDRSR
jgi:hypothetical protein